MSNFQKYKWVQELAIGVGSMGVIYEVINLERYEQTAVKVQPYDDETSDNEMTISCLVSQINGFIELYNFWICDDAPNKWKSSATGRDLMKHGKLFYLEMKKQHGSLHDLIYKQDTPISFRDRLSIAFELIYALRDAYDLLKFSHNDIKPDNILYDIAYKPRTYELKNGTKITCRTVFKAVWTDFGLSKLESQDFSPDMYGLVDLLSNHLNIFHENNEELTKIFYGGYNSYDEILEADIFSFINDNELSI
jgi:serine/threonine protein kinase